MDTSLSRAGLSLQQIAGHLGWLALRKSFLGGVAAGCMHARHGAGCHHPQQAEVQAVAVAAAQVSGRVTVWSDPCCRRCGKLPQLRSHVCSPHVLQPVALPSPC